MSSATTSSKATARWPQAWTSSAAVKARAVVAGAGVVSIGIETLDKVFVYSSSLGGFSKALGLSLGFLALEGGLLGGLLELGLDVGKLDYLLGG